MKKNFKPLYDKVLIQRVENEKTSVGGIIIPDSAQEKTQIGIVKAVGQGTYDNGNDSLGKLRPLSVKVGDSVIFGKYSGTEIKLEDQEYLIVREEEIFGIVNTGVIK